MATPTTDQILQLRRMTAESTEATYTDAELSAYIARYSLPDVDGLEPDAALWAGAWDLNQAAGEIWQEKAAAAAINFDFAADGGDYKRSQVYVQYMAIARSYLARRQTGSLILQAYPKPLGAVRVDSWIGNLSELATEGDYE